MVASCGTSGLLGEDHLTPLSRSNNPYDEERLNFWATPKKT